LAALVAFVALDAFVAIQDADFHSGGTGKGVSLQDAKALVNATLGLCNLLG